MSKKKINIVDNSLSDALGLPDLNNPISNSVNGLGMYSNSPAYLITLQPNLISNAYKTYGVLQAVVDQPVMDAFGGKIKFKCKTIDSDEIALLEKTMEDNGDFEVARNVVRWQRLYGGGVLIANSEQKPEKPLNKKSLFGRKLKFIASDRWESKANGTEGCYSDSFNFYEKIIDKTRVFTLIGKQAPYYIRLRLNGWGLSVYEQMLSDIIRFFKAQNVALELLDEAKIDVLKIFDLASALATKDGEELIKKRVNIASSQKNYKSMLAIDSNDDYEQKQINLSGIAPLQKEIRIMMCASTRMPEQKLYGIGSGGFSDDDGILETYNKMVRSEIQTPSKEMLMWMANLRCYQLFGREIPDLEVEFENLRELSRLEEVDLRVKISNLILDLKRNNLLTPKETMEALNQEGVFVMKTKALEGLMEDEMDARYGDLLKNDIESDS